MVHFGLKLDDSIQLVELCFIAQNVRIVFIIFWAKICPNNRLSKLPKRRRIGQSGHTGQPGVVKPSFEAKNGNFKSSEKKLLVNYVDAGRFNMNGSHSETCR